MFSIWYLFRSLLPASKSKPKPQVGKGKGNKGKGKTKNVNPIPAALYNFTEEQEESIAVWLESKKLPYEMKDKQYKDKALRRQFWEEKTLYYVMDCKY